MTTSFTVSLLDKHLERVLQEAPVPDDDEEMNWRLFLAHSQDMQGFAADIFIGGPNERNHPNDPAYQGVRDLWPGSSELLLRDVAAVWDDRELRAQLLSLTQGSPAGHGVREGLEVLGRAGSPGANLFADRLAHFTGDKIARKTNKMVRAYVQNAHVLSRYGYSYRRYLAAKSPPGAFPPEITGSIERHWRECLEHDLYNVGPAIANYMVCDWLLWLWTEGKIDWFESYKADSVHEDSVGAGLLPELASHNFVAFCRTVTIPPGHGSLSGRPCPPRVLNACLWLEGNQSSAPSSSKRLLLARRKRALGRPGPVARPRIPSVRQGAVGCILFMDDDAGYCEWLDRYPRGFVLNVERAPRAEYLKLHKARCSHIVGPRQRGQPLTNDYIKLCAPEEGALISWCDDRFGVPPQETCYCVRSAR